MQVKVKKSILINTIKELMVEIVRSDTQFDNSKHKFFGNFGSVKGPYDEDSEDLPLNPNPHMSVQLSIEEPPVDDPDFIPGTKEELSLAASRISKEVPHKKIEYFYRELHKLLDNALDEEDASLFDLNEAIDYDLIPNPAHKKTIKSLIDQAVAMASRSEDSKNYMSTDDAANFVLQNRMVSRYPDISSAFSSSSKSDTT